MTTFLGKLLGAFKIANVKALIKLILRDPQELKAFFHFLIRNPEGLSNNELEELIAYKGELRQFLERVSLYFLDDLELEYIFRRRRREFDRLSTQELQQRLEFMRAKVIYDELKNGEPRDDIEAALLTQIFLKAPPPDSVTYIITRILEERGKKNKEPR